MDAMNESWSAFLEFKNKSETGLQDLNKNLDQFFLVVMGMVVYLMQCGFAFLEAGAVRSKNSTNILIKNLMDSFVAGIAYWTIGYAFAYGDGNGFIGWTKWASHDMPDTELAEFFFQYVFAATAATIVSGAMAERCEFIAYFVYSFGITGFIYPVVTHWVWAGGWLATGSNYGSGNETFEMGYQDFAGSGVVHVLGGSAAFVGALLLGPRIGRFHKDQRGAVDLRGHSVPFAALGGFILLFGFLAFNGGSELSITGKNSGANVSLAVVNTIISGSMSAFVSLFIQKTPWLGQKHWSLLTTLNGALTGMVAACAGCNVMYPWGAVVVGFFAAISYKVWSTLMIAIKVDDPLDAVAVHFGGGLWGAISVAFLKKKEGILFAWDYKSALSLAWQLVGVLTITVWTGVLCFLMFGLLKLFKMLRVPEEIERKGLDIPKHGEPAYPMESYGHGWVEHVLKVLENGQLKEVQQADGNTTKVNPSVVNRAFEPDVGYDSMEVHVMAKNGVVQPNGEYLNSNIPLINGPENEKIATGHYLTPATKQYRNSFSKSDKLKKPEKNGDTFLSTAM